MSDPTNTQNTTIINTLPDEPKVEASLMSSQSTYRAPKSRGPVFAALFGVAILGGIIYCLSSAQDPEPSTPAATESSAKPAPAVNDMPARPEATAAVTKSPQKMVFFAYRDFRLTSAAKAELDLWADRLKSEKAMTLQLQGHCDERGTDAFNMRLGDRRANAAKHYLEAKGVPAHQLTTISYGRSRPLVTGHDEDSWSQNRRVEMHSVTALSSR